MSMYKIGEWGRVQTDFKGMFGVSFGLFYDGWMSYAFNRIVIDCVKFDEWLEKQYPDEWKTSSMEDILLSHYGKEGVRIIKNYCEKMTYGYIRVSTDKQTVENQRFEINRFCEEKATIIIKT